MSVNALEERTGVTENKELHDRLRKLEKMRTAEAKRDIEVVLGMREGRRLMQRILDMGRIHGTTFDKSAQIAAFQEGERNLGLKILELLSTNAPQYAVQMQIERIEADAEEKANG